MRAIGDRIGVFGGDNAATDDEVAALLTIQEGRPVSANEVRVLTARALRKVRQEFARRGLSVRDLDPRREFWRR